MNNKEPQSPCVSICVLDDGDICAGCYRSAREITDWAMLDADGKRAVLIKANERREEMSGGIKLL
ncbi:DUF1289 domain-containing protein [Halioglobus maricola]|uniref:DUF1289 domain-containing protein n=1 Tax=Halioglobus maricola TaxID=2601894 RepID=A0A5P9NI51_9GAMM|nr:DUF1289 domain-containing protein [Halioglobus maricola]QFU75503.1 DUF1289 domain-containing protein [Halioglobus maricola]